MHQDATWYGYRPQPRGFCVRWRPSRPSLKRGRSPLPQIFGPCLLWSNGWMDQDITWHQGWPHPRQLCVRWGPSPLPTKGVEPPSKFSAHFYCGQTAGCIKMPLGMEVGLRPGDFVLDGDPAPFPKRRRSPKFSAHVYCGQTAGWIKMPLGTEVGLVLRDIVFDVDPATPRKNAQPPPPSFWPMSIVSKWLDG